MIKPLCIPPMKINKIPEGKENEFPSICQSGKYFAQLKKDGYWYQYEKTEDASYLWSRTVSKVTGMLTEKGANVPHIMGALECLPPGTIIIGEIYYPGLESKDVTPIMGCLPDKAIERQQTTHGYLHYYIHDVIYYNHMDLTNVGAYNRYKILQAIVKKFNLTAYDFIELADIVENNIQEACAEALNSGEEGMVLKKKTAPYSPGKRPVWDTIKIKKTDSCDAVCMGSCEPTKYYSGKLNIGPNYTVIDPETGLTDKEKSLQEDNEASQWPYWIIEHYQIPEELGAPWILIDERHVDIGKKEVVKGIEYKTVPVTKAYYFGWPTAIRIGAYNENGELVEIGTISSGLSEKMQQELATYPLRYLNKVVELAGMEKHKEDHTLRHFYFKQVRDDKDPSECTLTSIFGE